MSDPKNLNSDIQAYKREVGMMKLEKLIAERESISTKPFPIPDEELLTRYEQLYTGAISDVLREFALLDQALPGHMKPLRPERTVAGLAFTVKSAPNVKITGEMTFRTQMLQELPKNTIVTWDTSGDEKATLWGGVMTATAVGLGVKGAVIDGGIRDTHQILEKDFPVFYKHRIPNGSLGRCLITHYQIPIKIGDVVIKPGDVVLGDIDGVVVIPRDIAFEVLVRAEEIKTNEKKIFSWVAEGQTIHQITEKGGYF
ncbi:MAG: RraA family protein [Opitutaceae bacterium]|nr:RraA family protein [Opitutaceae bacterium]